MCHMARLMQYVRRLSSKGHVCPRSSRQTLGLGAKEEGPRGGGFEALSVSWIEEINIMTKLSLLGGASIVALGLVMGSSAFAVGPPIPVAGSVDHCQ